jgi:hypothetical protein
MVEGYPFSVNCIQEDLKNVFANFRTWLNADAAVLLDRYLPVFGVDPVTPPVFVLLSARLADGAGNALLPALFMTIIYLAMALHTLPRQIQGRDRQLVILEGDYLYAHLSFILCQTNCLHLQERFSRLIRGMNEGSVMRRFYRQEGRPQAGDGLVEILGRQYGLFFAECCELGGLFAGLRQEETDLLRRFGQEFGVAYGCKEAGLEVDFYAPLLERALDCLNSLEGKEDLCTFARELVAATSGNRFLAAG